MIKSAYHSYIEVHRHAKRLKLAVAAQERFRLFANAGAALGSCECNLEVVLGSCGGRLPVLDRF